MTTPTTPDPLDVPPSVPALSFKNAAIGSYYTGTVTRVPELVQSRDFETGKRAWWDDAETEPKMSVVLHLDVNGTELALWAQKPSSMFAALAAAQTAVGVRMKKGDLLTVTFIGEEPNKTNPKLNPAKQYSVTLQPSDPLAGATNGHTPAPAPAAAPLPPAQPSAPATPPPSYSSVAPQPAAPGPAAPAAPAPAPAAAPAAAPAVDQLALLGQIKGLVGFGLTDDQIRATIPAATPEVLAAVRSIPVG